MGNYNDWFANQDEDFCNEVGPDLKQYWSKPINLKQLQDLDELHVHGNDPTDTNDIQNAPRADDKEVDI